MFTGRVKHIMRGKLGFTGKLSAEIERGALTYARYRAWLISDIFQWPFWTIFFFLSILMYSPASLSNAAVVKSMAYSFFAFIFVSSFLWSTASLVSEAQQGIIEQLILAKTSLRYHLVGRAVITAADIFVGGTVLLLLSMLVFGVDVSVAMPLHFAASIAIASVFFLLFSAVVSALMLSVKSPWIVVSMLQFIIPFSSGALPMQLLPQQTAEIITFNPLFYVIHPLVASATGSFYVSAEFLFPTAVAITAFMTILAHYAEKQLIRRAMKKGRLTLF